MVIGMSKTLPLLHLRVSPKFIGSTKHTVLPKITFRFLFRPLLSLRSILRTISVTRDHIGNIDALKLGKLCTFSHWIFMERWRDWFAIRFRMWKIKDKRFIILVNWGKHVDRSSLRGKGHKLWTTTVHCRQPLVRIVVCKEDGWKNELRYFYASLCS